MFQQPAGAVDGRKLRIVPRKQAFDVKAQQIPQDILSDHGRFVHDDQADFLVYLFLFRKRQRFPFHHFSVFVYVEIVLVPRINQTMHRPRHRSVFYEHRRSFPRRRDKDRFASRFQMQNVLHYVIDEKRLSRPRISRQYENSVVRIQKPLRY